MRIPILSSGLLLILGSCGTTAPAVDDLDPLPAWDYTQAAELVTTNEKSCGVLPVREGQPEQIRLLAWRSIVDDRPLHVDEALWWARFKRHDGRPYWVLATGFRHPEHELSDGRRWQLSFICDSPYQPLRIYSAPPGLNDLREIIDEPWFHAPEHFRVVQADVRERTWMAAFGVPPPAQFRP